MTRFFQKYVEFIRQPDVAPLLVVALLTRMPVGMIGFSMLMFLREALGSFALAGSAVGVCFVALAATAPIQGRLIDLYGPRRVLMVTLVAQPLALAAMLASAKLAMPYVVIATCAAFAGIFAPPVTTLTRTLWRQRFLREEDRRTAFALDAVAIEFNFTLGPVIIAALLATAGATAAFAVTIAVVIASMIVFIASPAMGYFKRETGAQRHLLGPLTEPRLWLVFLTTFGLATCFGLLEVCYPAYATAMAMPAIGGVLLAVNAIGSGIGGALYGGIAFKAPVERQLACALGLMVAPLLLHAALIDQPIPFTVMAFLAGALIAPSIAAQSVLVSRLAPPQYATEAFTWSSTFIVCGLGAGIAFGGALVETVGLRFAFVAGGCIVASMALLALTIPAGTAATRASAAE